MRTALLTGCLGLVLLAAGGLPGWAQDFERQAPKGTTLTVLTIDRPWARAMRGLIQEFTAKTGIATRLQMLEQERYRTRLATLMHGHSAELDVFMSLPSPEGPTFAKAGWYADLVPLMKDQELTTHGFDLADFGAALAGSNRIDGKLVALPVSVEGPLLWWRKDILQACGVAEPMAVEDLLPAAEKLKACPAAKRMGMISPWAAPGTRTAASEAVGGFVWNLGGDYAAPGGKPGLCQSKTLPALELYGGLLKEYAPSGATGLGLAQVVDLLGKGEVAMAVASSDALADVLRFPGRFNDLGVKPLPPGRTSGVSKPVATGWALSVSAFSQKRQAAWLFLQWATSPETELRLAQDGVAPSRNSVFAAAAFRSWSDELPIRRAWAESLATVARTGTGIYQSPTDKVMAARSLTGNAIRQIVLGKTPKEAACAADADLSRLQ